MASDSVKCGEIGNKLSMRYLLVMAANTDPSDKENLADRFDGFTKKAKTDKNIIIMNPIKLVKIMRTPCRFISITNHSLE